MFVSASDKNKLVILLATEKYHSILDRGRRGGKRPGNLLRRRSGGRVTRRKARPSHQKADPEIGDAGS